ncbi:MAG TPA: hypothetical protein VGQ57_19490 [Polyangiaceae bacterium]|nr:hypothetical protein [Polyangiaceae bacterium]
MNTPLPEQPEIFDGDDEPQKLVRFLKRMLHYWPAVLIAVGLGALLCSAFVVLRHPPYRSETVLLYTPGVSATDNGEQSSNPRNATVRLKEMLFSRPKLSQVVNGFGLYRDVQKKYGSEDAVEELKRHVEFKAPGGDTFSIAFSGTTPAEAQRVTQALAKVVIEGDAELRKTQTELGRDFLASEKASKTAELKSAEERLAVFMGEHRRFALDATPLVAGAAIRALNEPAPAARPSFGYAAPRAAAPHGDAGMPAPAAPAPSPQSEERARALAALAAARANLAEQLEHYTPAHPDVRAAQGEVDRATARLASLGAEPRPAAPTAAPAPVAAKAAAAPAPRHVFTGAPSPAPRATTGEKEDVVALETEWARLTREVTAARQRLDQVEAALFKAETLASSERAGRAVQISVIDPAFLPERPTGLGLNVIIAIFLAGGLAFGVLAAAFAAVLDDHVYTALDLPRGSEALVEVPKIGWLRRTHAAQ